MTQIYIPQCSGTAYDLNLLPESSNNSAAVQSSGLVLTANNIRWITDTFVGANLKISSASYILDQNDLVSEASYALQGQTWHYTQTSTFDTKGRIISNTIVADAHFDSFALPNGHTGPANYHFVDTSTFQYTTDNLGNNNQPAPKHYPQYIADHPKPTMRRLNFACG